MSVKGQKAESDIDFTARACAFTYALLAGVWALLLLLWVHSALRHTPGAWNGVAAAGSTLAFVLLWIGCFRISIRRNTLSYRSLFGGTKTLGWNEIERSEIKVNTTKAFAPVWQLALWPEPITQKKPIVINMKVFSKADLNRVFDFLGPKLKTKRRFSFTRAEREDLLRKIP